MNKDLKLPDSIKVRISLVETGYFAELPEYDIFTQANTLDELDFMINDLIMVFFDVPESLRSSVQYVNVNAKHNKIDLASHLIFQKFISSEAIAIFR